MDTVSPERTNSAPRSELATLFAAAIRRLLERAALTSPISPELSASRLDVRPQTGLNGRHGCESRVDLNPETALLGVYPRINRIFTNPNRQLHPFKNQFLCVHSCEFVLFVDRLQRMTVKELRAKFADVCGDETRSGNRAWLSKRIAWRMQANHGGGLTERARNPSRCRRIPAFPCPEPSS